MKQQYDLTPIENFLTKKSLTMNEVARKLYSASIEMAYLSLYCNKFAISDLQKIPAENIAESAYWIGVFAEAFVEDNLQEFFTETSTPGEVVKDLLDTVTVYQKAIAGLVLSNMDDSYPVSPKTNDYILLLGELADLCLEIEKVSEKAA